MYEYIINGGKQLFGDVSVQGAKNAVLPLFAAAVLTNNQVTIKNCPQLADVENMGKIITSLGANVQIANHTAVLDGAGINSYEIPHGLACKLRSSIFLLGSVLGRMGRAKIAYPGGCDIGLRPIDIHIKALSTLNVKIKEKGGYIYCDSSNLMPCPVTLDYPSVGATENVMLLTAVSNGITVINNVAREPEIEDLQNFLNAMGAKISGAGSSQIFVQGVPSLHGAEYTTMPDRIVLGTYMIAVAMCGGKINISGGNLAHISALINKLEKSGCKIRSIGDNILVSSEGNPISFEDAFTQPYPGFPTDMQAQATALASVARGTTVITENIFETRFKHVPELIKMGAKINVQGRVAVVTGVPNLVGAEVSAYDLRGGASLVLAGLKASGTTVVKGIGHIERGYEGIEKNFSALGADIEKLERRT